MLTRFMRFRLLVLLALGLLLPLISSCIARPVGPVTITLLHTSEHHGQVLPAKSPQGTELGGVSARATLVKQIRAQVGASNLLLVDSGDILIGTPMSTVFRGEPDVLAYNAIGYAAAALGNHEFDFEKKENRLQTLMGLAKYPMMGANISGLDFPTNSGFIKKTVGGLTVLIIGIANPDTPNVSSPKPGTAFADPITTVQNIIETQGRGAALIVAITHENSDRDVALLKAVPKLNVVIGGHTVGFRGMVTRSTFAHPEEVPDAIGDQPVELTNPDGIFVRAGEGPFYGRLGTSLGRLDLTIEHGVILKAVSQNIPVIPDTESNRTNNVSGRIPLDPQIEAILQPYIQQIGVRLQEVIGRTTVILDGEREDVRAHETNLGDFIADVWRRTQGTDIGLENGGGIRASIPAGEITLSEVLTTLPFGNTIVKLKVTGAQLFEAMENSVSQIEQGAGRFLQISGITLTFDPSKPVGSRVVQITVGSQPLDPNKIYSVATNNFVAGGGDGYTVFTQAMDLLDTQFVDADVLANFIRDAGTISPQVEGRIQQVSSEH